VLAVGLMCIPGGHVFLFVGNQTTQPVLVGMRCICGHRRWGTEAELRALDEVAELERLLAVPAHVDGGHP
jgi:hypothetical protein